MDELAKEVRRLERELQNVYTDYETLHTSYVAACEERDIAIQESKSQIGSLTQLTESASSLQLRVRQQNAYIKKVCCFNVFN